MEVALHLADMSRKNWIRLITIMNLTAFGCTGSEPPIGEPPVIPGNGGSTEELPKRMQLDEYVIELAAHKTPCTKFLDWGAECLLAKVEGSEAYTPLKEQLTLDGEDYFTFGKRTKLRIQDVTNEEIRNRQDAPNFIRTIVEVLEEVDVLTGESSTVEVTKDIQIREEPLSIVGLPPISCEPSSLCEDLKSKVPFTLTFEFGDEPGSIESPVKVLSIE